MHIVGQLYDAHVAVLCYFSHSFSVGLLHFLLSYLRYREENCKPYLIFAAMSLIDSFITLNISSNVLIDILVKLKNLFSCLLMSLGSMANIPFVRFPFNKKCTLRFLPFSLKTTLWVQHFPRHSFCSTIFTILATSSRRAPSSSLDLAFGHRRLVDIETKHKKRVLYSLYNNIFTHFYFVNYCGSHRFCSKFDTKVFNFFLERNYQVSILTWLVSNSFFCLFQTELAHR